MSATRKIEYVTSVAVHATNFCSTIVWYTGHSNTADSMLVVAAITIIYLAWARASTFAEECGFDKETSCIRCDTVPKIDVMVAAMLIILSLAVQVVCCTAFAGHFI